MGLDYLVICTAALAASGLTFFSGFGLGTLLMPVFAIFFQVEVAIAMTAVVHLLNNLFKLALIGRHADRTVVLRFGLPGIGAAFLGAWALLGLSGMAPIFEYELFGHIRSVTPVKLMIALLLIIFAAVELIPGSHGVSFDRRYLPLGGALSGFFGGLSGNQGALRSFFLLKTGLSREGFIATGVAIACLVDLSRLTIYGAHFFTTGGLQNLPLLSAATLSAFAGALIGRRLIRKVTMRSIKFLVSLMLFGIAILLGAGLI